MALTVGTALGFSGATAVIVGGATILAGTYIVAKATMPDMPEFDSQQLGQSGTMVNAITPNADHEIVYGTVRKGGVTIFQEITDNNRYLHEVIVIAGHEVSAINDIYFNAEQATLTGNDVTGGKYAGKVRVKKYLGDQTTADSDLVAETSAGSDFIVQGCAYIYLRYDFDPDVFTAGNPVVTVDVDGKKVYNPDTGVTAFSNNAALCIRDYLTSDYGLEVPFSQINDTSFIQAAADCEISLGVGAENKFLCNGVLTTGDTYEENINKMTSSCQGILYFSQGAYELKVGVYRSPSVIFTEKNLRSAVNLATKKSRRDQFNQVQGVFADSNQNYVLADYPLISSNVFITEDGGADYKSTMDINLPMTTDSTTAQRLAKLALYRSREQLAFVADFDLTAFAVNVGDNVYINFERFGFVNKIFEVVGWSFKSDRNGPVIQLTLQETSSSAYAWDNEEQTIVSNNTTLTDVTAGLAINNLSATNNTSLQSDGTTVDEFIVSWDAAASAMVDFYEVQWKQTSQSGYASSTTRNTTFVISPVLNVQYDIRVRAITVNGNKGAFSNTAATGGGDSIAPSAPTSVTATGAQAAIVIQWTNPADPDLRYVDVYENDTNNSGTSIKIGRSSGTSFYRANLGDVVTKYYWVKAVDNSGNESGFSAVATATTNAAIVSKGGGLYRLNLVSGDVISYKVTAAGGQYFLDGVASPDIELYEGYTYRFDQSDPSNTGHPLAFSTTSDGTHGGGTEYTTGVTQVGTAGSSGAYTQIAVAASAPTLYYYCEVHAGYGATAETPNTKTTAVLTKLFKQSYGDASVEPAPSDRLLVTDNAFYSESYAYVFNGVTWDAQDEFIDGNFLVTGTITGDRLVANTLSGLGLTIGTLTDNPTGERITISDSQILVYDASNVVRVKIGDLT